MESAEGFTVHSAMCYSMTTSSGDVPFAIDGQTLSHVEEASESVGGPISVEMVLLITGLAVVAVGVLGILTYLYSAREDVAQEIEEVAAERDAFLAFTDRIEGIPVDRTASAVATPHSIQTLDSGGPPVDDIASAFEETVMSLPHYADTYGEDPISQMAIELDADLVASLNRPGTLSETAKEGLRQQAADAASKREDLLAILEEEHDELEAAEADVDSILAVLRRMNDRHLSETPYSALGEHHEELGTLRERVNGLVEDRQRTIHKHIRTLTWNREDVTLQEYLYGEGDTTYPVLTTATRLDRLIGRARARVRRALWTRS